MIFAMAGCASAPQTYDLRPAPASAHVSRGSISVDIPTAAPPLDTDLIVVREAGDLLSRLPDARWADRLTLLVQSRTIETFENAGLLRQLRSSGDTPSYRLMLGLRRFDIDAPNRVAQVEISAQVVSSSGQVSAAKIFTSSEPLGEIAGPQAAQALDRAFGHILPRLVAWAAAAG
ncbi:MAG: ABC-type transport auxiliary lipoprotein family protein [Rhodoblastus sp.]|uniref:ABC-type transport auxiliary lipoprotein family protein n=2 Tax=Rhodoblastus sp. TaxID=1962975 RepID=UPI003F989FEC